MLDVWCSLGAEKEHSKVFLRGFMVACKNVTKFIPIFLEDKWLDTYFSFLTWNR